MLERLPIDAAIDEIRGALQRARAVVIVASPGAGKTTRVPPALLDGGPLILLQPRRAAARTIASRIAREQGWTIGQEIGWDVRFDKRFSAATTLLVATEGILTARLQHDPLATAFNTIVLDEFHERSVYADLGLALARQAWRARTDLRLVVMSATLDTDPVSAFLDDCPVVRVPGILHPLEIRYAPGQSIEEAAAHALTEATGDVLAFAPGAREIAQAVSGLTARVGSGVDVLSLHGTLTLDAQDRVLRGEPSPRRRIIVATNLAETSVTVPGVTAVVDSGLQKVARYDAARAIDSLVTERVTLDAADQRAGRAARLGPGVAWRLWDQRDRLRPHREADVHRIDLSSVALDILAWGGDPRCFEWFDAPRPDALDASLDLLERLGALRAHALTDIGRRMSQLPLHPRLARILIAGGGSRSVARACALLSERVFVPARSASTTSDLLSALDDWNRLPSHLDHVAKDIERLAGADARAPRSATALDDAEFRRALLAGYPDRVAQRRSSGSSRLKLASGAGASLSDESGVRDGEFLIALDLRTSTRPGDPDGIVRLASRVEREWLEATDIEIRTWLEGGRVRSAEEERYGAIVLREKAVPVDAAAAARLVADAWLTTTRTAADERLLRRLRFAGCEIDLGEAAHAAAYGIQAVTDLRIERALSAETLRQVEQQAPETLLVPSGRRATLDYNDDGTVSASVKLQELFGLGETPKVGPRNEPVLLALLAPNGRPVQLTRDLRSFWNRTYPEVRKELRGRYPRHPWPDDPWNAPPTARTTRRPKP